MTEMWAPRTWTIPNDAPPLRREMAWPERIGRKKIGNPDETVVAAWEAFGDGPERDVMLTFNVGTTYCTKATKKRRVGEPNYDGEDKRALVTVMEINAAKAEFVRVTGLCAECQGDGLSWAGWNHLSGHKIRECHHCRGTGKAAR